MNKAPRCVPWRDSNEWMFVYRALLNQQNNNSVSSTALKEIIDRILWWQQRGRLPKAIEATLSLLQVKQTANITQTDYSCSIIRHALNSVLIRFVNTMVDGEQSKLYAQSVATLAASLSIPRVLVDLRHEGTHNPQIPSMEILEQGAEMALNWLIANYWTPQARWNELLREELKDTLTRIASSASDANHQKSPFMHHMILDKLKIVEHMSFSRQVQKCLLEAMFMYPDLFTKGEIGDLVIKETLEIMLSLVDKFPDQYMWLSNELKQLDAPIRFIRLVHERTNFELEKETIGEDKTKIQHASNFKSLDFDSDSISSSIDRTKRVLAIYEKDHILTEAKRPKSFEGDESGWAESIDYVKSRKPLGYIEESTLNTK